MFVFAWPVGHHVSICVHIHSGANVFKLEPLEPWSTHCELNEIIVTSTEILFSLFLKKMSLHSFITAESNMLYFYIVTTDTYLQQNRYKFGYTKKSKKALGKRYVTLHPDIRISFILLTLKLRQLNP